MDLAPDRFVHGTEHVGEHSTGHHDVNKGLEDVEDEEDSEDG
jgi:hypothetical protein